MFIGPAAGGGSTTIENANTKRFYIKLRRFTIVPSTLDAPATIQLLPEPGELFTVRVDSLSVYRAPFTNRQLILDANDRRSRYGSLKDATRATSVKIKATAIILSDFLLASTYIFPHE